MEMRERKKGERERREIHDCVREIHRNEEKRGRARRSSHTHLPLAVLNPSNTHPTLMESLSGWTGVHSTVSFHVFFPGGDSMKVSLV